MPPRQEQSLLRSFHWHWGSVQTSSACCDTRNTQVRKSHCQHSIISSSDGTHVKSRWPHEEYQDDEYRQRVRVYVIFIMSSSSWVHLSMTSFESPNVHMLTSLIMNSVTSLSWWCEALSRPLSRARALFVLQNLTNSFATKKIHTMETRKHQRDRAIFHLGKSLLSVKKIHNPAVERDEV